jgi:hypothetical protein
MTSYQRHCKQWRDCRKCPLCEGRKRVVLARGTIPAPILFIGEAPGARQVTGQDNRAQHRGTAQVRSNESRSLYTTGRGW